MRLYAEWSKVDQPPQLGEVVWVRDLHMVDVQGVIVEVDPVPEVEELDREQLRKTGRWLHRGFVVTVCARGCGSDEGDLFVQTRFHDVMRKQSV